MAKKTFVQNNNNLAIAYYRYSSRSQNDASIAQQREMAHKYADEHDLQIIAEYDDKAESGLNDDRENFNIMLSEVSKLKPSVLILWKTDRLSRDRITLALAKSRIRESGCSIRCVAEAIPDENENDSIIIEGLMDAMAEYYSVQLSTNIRRGIKYNADRCLYNGTKMLGYKKGEDNRYTIDEDTAPIVLRIFNDYIAGKKMAQIARELNFEGLKSAYGNDFGVNGLRSILKNRAYIGEYRLSGVVVPGGMPALITEEQFNQAQKMFALNKRKRIVNNNADAPRFWLTGKLYCGECGESMHGSSGTSKTGKTHYYYKCQGHKKHICDLKDVKKDWIEDAVERILDDFLSDSEWLATIAVDVAAYNKKRHSDDTFLKSLQKSLKDNETALKNMLKAIEQGILTETTKDRLLELEAQNKALKEAIECEKAKLSVNNDDCSIEKYFSFYAHADLKDEETRNFLLEYIIDKIYLYKDKILITCYYSDDNKTIPLSELEEELAFMGRKRGSTCSCFAPPKLIHLL